MAVVLYPGPTFNSFPGTTGTITLPTHVDGDLLFPIILGTPTGGFFNGGVNIPSYASLDYAWEDVPGFSTDFATNLMGKVAASDGPTLPITVGSAYDSGGAGATNSRWSATAIRAANTYGDLPDVVQSWTEPSIVPSTTPWAPPPITLPRQSTVVCIVAQRRSTAPTVHTANGFTNLMTLTSGGLARSLRIMYRTNVDPGAFFDVPLFNVGTAGTNVLIGTTFNIGEVALPSLLTGSHRMVMRRL